MRLRFCAVVLLLTSCASHQTLERYGKLAVVDARTIASAPLHADAKQWKRTAIAAAAVGGTILLDDEIRRAVTRNDSHFLGEFTDAVEPLGGRHAPKLITAAFLYGGIRRDDRMINVAFDAFISSMVASRGITPALKAITQRTRPNGGDDSFPSNHTTEAFALAGTVASHYRQRWVRATAYGLATAVGFARIYHDDHWASDVVAGAIIGNVVARKIARVNDAERLRWTVAPARNGIALNVSINASELFRARSEESSRRGRNSSEP